MYLLVSTNSLKSRHLLRKTRSPQSSASLTLRKASRKARSLAGACVADTPISWVKIPSYLPTKFAWQIKNLMYGCNVFPIGNRGMSSRLCCKLCYMTTPKTGSSSAPKNSAKTGLSHWQDLVLPWHKDVKRLAPTGNGMP